MTLILLLRIMHRIGQEYSFNEGYNFIFLYRYFISQKKKKMELQKNNIFHGRPHEKSEDLM